MKIALLIVLTVAALQFLWKLPKLKADLRQSNRQTLRWCFHFLRRWKK